MYVTVTFLINAPRIIRQTQCLIKEVNIFFFSLKNRKMTKEQRAAVWVSTDDSQTNPDLMPGNEKLMLERFHNAIAQVIVCE